MESKDTTDTLKPTLKNDLRNLNSFFKINYNPLDRSEQVVETFNKFNEPMTPNGSETKSAEVVYENPSADLRTSVLQLVTNIKDLDKAHNAGLNVPHITAVHNLVKTNGDLAATNSGIMDTVIIELPTPDGSKTKDLVQIEIFHGNNRGDSPKSYQGNPYNDPKMASAIDDIIDRALKNQVQRIDVTKISINRK